MSYKMTSISRILKELGRSDLESLIDGAERGINRPKHKESQKENYSGKKKVHTAKNNIITEMNRNVVFLSDTYEEV